jgi:hypothetical protein
MQMEEWSGKEKVIKQKGKLRGNRATEKIFIDNDPTKQEREIQKKLRAGVPEEREREKMKNDGEMVLDGRRRKNVQDVMERECNRAHVERMR